MGWMAPFEWASGKLLYGAGVVAGWTGSEDYSEFLKAAGTIRDEKPYIEKAWRAMPSNLTEDQRREFIAEQGRYGKRVVDEIAPDVESSLVTAAQGVAILTPAGPLGAVAVEQLTDQMLIANGDAPTRSLMKRYSPLQGDYGDAGNFAVDLIGVRGDKHYADGGKADDHPLRLAAQQGLAAQQQNIAREQWAAQHPGETFPADIQAGASQPSAADEAKKEGFWSKILHYLKEAALFVIAIPGKVIDRFKGTGSEEVPAVAVQPATLSGLQSHALHGFNDITAPNVPYAGATTQMTRS